MKFKRDKKYQYGGSMAGASVSVPLTPQVTPTKSPFQPYKLLSKQDLGLGVDKSKYKMSDKVELKGLTSDVKAQRAKMRAADAKMAGLSELDILANTEEAQEIISEWNKAYDPTEQVRLENNQADYEKAVTALNTNKGEGAALTYGRNVGVFDGDSKEVKFISTKELALKPDQYRLLSGAEAAEYRQNVFSGQNDLTFAMRDTYGLNYINKYLNEQISGLGEYSKTVEGALAVAANVPQYQGYTKIKQSGNSAQVKALDSTWNMLTESQKAQLEIAALRAGADANNMTDIAKGIMSSVFSKAYKSDNVFEQDLAKLPGAGGKSGGSEKKGELGSWLYSWNKLQKGDASDITVGTGDASFRTKGQVITRWRSKGDSPLLVANDAIGAAGKVSEAYTIDGKKLKDFKDGYLYNESIIAPGTEVSYTYLPVDTEGKPAVTESNIKNLQKFNDIYSKVYENTGNPRKAAVEASKQTGIQAIRVEPFIATTLLGSHQFDSSFAPWTWGNADFGFQKVDESTKERYQNALKIDNLDPFGSGDREVYQYTAYIPLSDKEGIFRADQTVKAAHDKITSQQYDEMSFYPDSMDNNDIDNSNLEDQPE